MNVSEDLLDILADMDEVTNAAQRLGIEPREAAERIRGDLLAFKMSIEGEHTQHELAYQVARKASQLARALTA